ncbi:unnamed protein product [Ambrosiozyma monospora]|uniref:Unnamed protein product n=1 Tax=Ambrosiozyma monospora TaxID=43982 RepID=A0ACB5SSJ5_AMBMO|nr:unnamed protein product [Ambrosiozyma monospora]
MPRLRKVVQERYTFTNLEEFNEDEPIDIQTQEEIIDKFSQSIPFNTNRDPNSNDKLMRKVLYGIEILLGLLNLMLITVPHYRKENSLLSCLSGLSILATAIVIQTELLGSRSLSSSFKEYGITTNRLIIGSHVIAFFIAFQKVCQFESALDLVFFLPLVIVVSIWMLLSDIKSLSKDVEELKKLKYNYKEA